MKAVQVEGTTSRSSETTVHGGRVGEGSARGGATSRSAEVTVQGVRAGEGTVQEDRRSAEAAEQRARWACG